MPQVAGAAPVLREIPLPRNAAATGCLSVRGLLLRH